MSKIQHTWAAVSAIPNPLKPSETIIFSSGNDRKLSVDRRTIGGTPGSNSDSRLKGLGVEVNLAESSQLVSTIYQDVVTVYGISNSSRTEDASKYELCMVSPIKALIKNIWGDESDARHLTGLDSVLPGTSLSVTYSYDRATSTETRVLIYQRVDRSITMYNFGSNQGAILRLHVSIDVVDFADSHTVSTFIGSAAYANEPSSLAAVVVPSQDGSLEGSRIVLYFIANSDRNFYLYFLACSVGDSKASQSLSNKPQQVGTGYPCMPSSQLGVSLDSAHKQTIIWARTAAGDLVSMPHPWVDLTSSDS
ncbi:unnamed protein product [Parascedosporium putredinis]|uniref:Uncharacterized protein n=1 Tax=Parascedosporium putredinis TaxID=1442378 RepID=A0A9P1GZ57_9PEZI|nr:unnamed protein product [Parascedosporium putredinis]CAI7992502.1 unnamed protein product [Parascedosporium putredinis]